MGLALTPHYYTIQGRAAEIARAMGSPVAGAEHLFLGMLRDGGWPVRVLSGDETDPATTRQVVNTALASLDRPALDNE